MKGVRDLKPWRAILLFLLAATCTSVWARTIYVDDDKPANFNNIQAAINNANDCDIIVVRPGIYTGIGNRDIDFLGKAITVCSIEPNDPNIVAGTIIDCNGTEEEPHRGFYFHRGEDTNSILNGITIINGYVIGDWPDYIGGGAILCENSGPTVANCIITDNSTNTLGSAIYCVGSSPTITNNTITKNRTCFSDGIVIFSKNHKNLKMLGNMISDNYAGPTPFNVRVSIWGSGAVEIKNNIFVNNGLELGGYLSNALVSNNTFEDFTDEYGEFAIRIGGADNNANTVTIRRNVFSNFVTNFPSSNFGAISIGGTGDEINTGIIENNAFENIGGKAIQLGGTGSAHIYGQVRNNTFANNKGTAIDLGGTSGAKVNGYIINNSFVNCGFFEGEQNRLPTIRIGGTGGVNIFAECMGNLIIGKGMLGLVPAIEIGGKSSSKQHAIFKNNTIVNNEQGIVKGSNVYSLEIINCILWDNTENFHGVAKQEIHYCDISEEWYSESNGNICLDPCFTDPCNGDYHLKSQAGRWDPNSQSWVKDDVTSPCIDAGNPGCPLGDEPAPNGNRRNIGAYGGTAEASKSPAYWRSIADITNDWIVDSNDLKVFVDYWLNTGECIPGDLNRSQSVDFTDFALLANNWLRSSHGKSVFDFGVATKGPLHMAGNIEPEGGNISIESDVYIVSENSSLALVMIGNSHIAGEAFIVNPFGTVGIQGVDASIGGETGPSALDHVFTGIDPVKFPVPNPSYFEHYVVSDINYPSTETTFENIRIPPNTNPSFSGVVTMNGIVFIETPNVVTFSGSVNINGIIVGNGNINDDSRTNRIDFMGTVNSSPVSELPEEFGELREETGTFLMAPGFNVSFGGNFYTISGAIAANGIQFYGNAGGTIEGTLLNYSNTAMELSGISYLYFNRFVNTEMPAGFE